MHMDPDQMRQLLQQLAARGTTLSRTGDGNPAAAAAAAAPVQSDDEPQGNSRRFREKNGWELSGPMSFMPPSMICTPSPVVPLKFEQPPGEWSGGDCKTANAGVADVVEPS